MSAGSEFHWDDGTLWDDGSEWRDPIGTVAATLPAPAMVAAGQIASIGALSATLPLTLSAIAVNTSVAVCAVTLAVTLSVVAVNTSVAVFTATLVAPVVTIVAAGALAVMAPTLTHVPAIVGQAFLHSIRPPLSRPRQVLNSALDRTIATSNRIAMRAPGSTNRLPNQGDIA